MACNVKTIAFWRVVIFTSIILTGLQKTKQNYYTGNYGTVQNHEVNNVLFTVPVPNTLIIWYSKFFNTMSLLHPSLYFNNHFLKNKFTYGTPVRPTAEWQNRTRSIYLNY